MMLRFLKEYAMWIMFFVVTFIWMNVVFRLDAGFTNVSVLYFNLVYSILFIVFLCWRYLKYNRQALVLQKYDIEQPKQLALTPLQEIVFTRYTEQLQQQQALVNDLNVQLQEQSDDLLAWVHEVKSPLTSLKLLIEQTGDIKQKVRLEQEWLRLYLLVDQQLHQTRLQTIEQDNRMQQVPLRTVIVQEIRDLQSWCIEKGIGFEIEELEQTVITDQKWLGFILRQILTNAVKYSHPNGEIHITTSNQNSHLLLHIEDRGVGISSEDLPRVFRKSYTGTVGRESTAATGMGLYLAQNAAVKLGITISIQSQLAKGTCVTLTFPEANHYTKSYGM